MPTTRPQRTGSRSVRKITLINLFHVHSLDCCGVVDKVCREPEVIRVDCSAVGQDSVLRKPSWRRASF